MKMDLRKRSAIINFHTQNIKIYLFSHTHTQNNIRKEIKMLSMINYYRNESTIHKTHAYKSEP